MTQQEMARRINDLEGRLGELERRIANFPVRFAAGGGGGIALPPGGRKLDVLMKIDDFGTNGWERIRFHE